MIMTRFPVLAAVTALLFACGTPEERAADHLAAAQRSFEEGDLVKAKLEAKSAAQIEPKNIEVRLLLADIAEREQDYRGAFGQLLVAVDIDPDNVESQVRVGRYYFLSRDPQRAREVADKARQLDPDNPKVRLLHARVLYLEGDEAGAMAEVDQVLAIAPGLADAVMFKAGLLTERDKFNSAFSVLEAGLQATSGEEARPLREFSLQLLRRAGKTDEIEQALQSLVADFPEEDRYRFALAQFYVGEDRLADAEQVLRGMIDRDPDNAEPKLALVRLLAEQQGIDAAAPVLREFIDDAPGDLQLALALGNLYEDAGLRDDAIAAYQRVADQAPTSPEGLTARNRTVATMLADGDLDASRRLVERILSDAPDDAEALLYRAAFRFADEEYAGAIADLRVALRQDQTSEPALLMLARAHVRSGDAVLAQDAYRRLLDVNPAHEAGTGELAALLGAEGDLESAEALLRQRLDADASDSRATVALVRTLLTQGELAAAEAEARRLVELDSGNALAQFQLGEVKRAQGSIDEAVEAYRTALARDPRAIPALRGLVTILAENGRPAEAMAAVREYLEAYPDDPDARFLLANLLARDADLEGAAEIFEDLVAERPDVLPAWLALAGLWPAGHPERLAVYQRAMAANPDEARIGLLLATEYYQLARYEDAIELYERMLERNPDNVLVLNNLISLLLERRDDETSHGRALELARKLEASEQPAVLDTVGWAYYVNGDYPGAIRFLERAAASATQNALIRYHLGMAYVKNNNPVGARQELTQALELATADFPGIEDARATLEQLEAS